MSLKNFFIFLSIIFLLSVSGCAPHPREAHSMWRCNATNAGHRHWSHYAATRIEAAQWVRETCRKGSYVSTCEVHCFPPKSRWHCVAVDAKSHTWYRNSVRKEKAVKNALHACQRHSPFGGCRVRLSKCSVT